VDRRFRSKHNEDIAVDIDIDRDIDDYNYDYDYDESGTTGFHKTALVVGSSGALGRSVVRHLAKDLGVRVVGADVVVPRSEDEPHLKGGFVALPTFGSNDNDNDNDNGAPEPTPLVDLTVALADGLHQLLGGGTRQLDAVICVAGGWEGDPEPPEWDENTDENIDENENIDDNGNDNGNDNDDDNSWDAERSWLAEGALSYASTIDRMMGKNLAPVLAAGYAAQHFMTAGNSNSDSDRKNGFDDGFDDFDFDDESTRREGGGLFVTIGATVALGGTPGMMGYGLSKAATHHFVRTLGESTGKAVTSQAKRRKTRKLWLRQQQQQHQQQQQQQDQKNAYLPRLSVVGILPTTLDTPANREAMPSEDFAKWTQPADVAREIGVWLVEPALRPHSGSLIKVHPKRDGSGAEFLVAR